MARTTSIRNSLLARLAVLFAAGMVALYLAATSYARYAADASYDRLLLGSAGSIAETLSVTPEAIRVDIPYAALDMLSAAPDDRVYYRVIGPDGSTVTGYPDLPFIPSQRGSGAGSASGTRVFDANYRSDRVRFAAISRDIRHAGVSGRVWVEVGQTRIARASLASDLIIRALLPILGMTLLAILIVWFTVGRAMRPLEAFGAEIAAREPSDLSALEGDAPREIAPLIEAVNGFMGRLDKTMDVLKVFIADAAHQLRTPITALLLQMRAAQGEASRGRTGALGEAHRSAERLARLVDQLLGEAMVAHRAQVAHTTTFDLRGVVEQALLDCRPLMEAADVRFTATAENSLVSGDPVLVGEAIKNIVHNAIKHAREPAKGDVRIELELVSAEDECLLTVTDDGVGISESEISLVGARFRSGPNATQGAGLGLAIAGDVMRSQGGTMSIRNRQDGSGLIVTLRFPAAPCD